MQQNKDWPHAPVHRLDSAGIYIVTGGTLHKKQFFQTADTLTLLENSLLTLSKHYEWQLEAWSVFVNHYHFVGRCYRDAPDLHRFLKLTCGDCT
jgi:putative transposase